MCGPALKPKAKLLVLEDNPADVELLRLALEDASMDCQLTVIGDGAEVLALLSPDGKGTAAPVPDLIVVDLNLPKHDGIEILEAIRANDRFDAVPIAVMSSSAWPRERGKIQALGVASYIIKPANLEEYLAIGTTIRDLLGDSRNGNSG